MRGRNIIGLMLLVLVLPFIGQAQWAFQRTLNIPVSANNKTLVNAWMGGMNCPQFMTIDLDNDGMEDLVVFDRGYYDAGPNHSGHKLLTLLNKGGNDTISYIYAPQYESWFPTLDYWMKLEDFNCDGVKDILSCEPDQINLYMGNRDSNGQLHFTYRNFIPYNTYLGPINIFVSTADIPGVGDVNGDGDLDIVTFAQLGTVATIDYFENQSEELTGTCGDTLVFEHETACWGGITQNGQYQGVIISDSCALTGKTGGWLRHNGNSLLLFHQHSDSLEDLLLGDIYYNNLDFLANGGNRNFAKMIFQDTAFPAYNVPINMPTFPAAYYLDVNNDGKNDLIIAPNATNVSLNYNCAWYYKNVSVNDTVKFQFQTDSFLVNTMLDFGQGAYPAFFDYNGDGLMDIVVGNYGYFDGPDQYHGGLALLQNTGTATSPAFKLVSKDFAGLSEMTYNGNPLLGITPTFGDMDGDGKPDMIIGDTSGRLHYFKNVPNGKTASFILADSNYSGINVGGFSAPFIYDVNGDGLPDLLIGRVQGNIWYFQNRGTVNAPIFDPVPTNTNFGGVDTRYPGFLEGYSTPVITRLDSTNQLYLLSGNEEGRIVGYLFDRNLIDSGSFTKVFDSYSGIHEGERTAVTIADIDNDGKMEMVVGNYRGGLGYFKQVDSLETLGIKQVNIPATGFTIFPNPVSGIFNIRTESPLPYGSNIIVTDILGRRLMEQEIGQVSVNGVITVNVQDLLPGLYICMIQTAGGTRALKFMKQY